MATAENPSSPPVNVIGDHGLTAVSVHCDVELSEQRFANINENLIRLGHHPIRNRRRQFRWANRGQTGDFWEFHIETRNIADREAASPTFHFVLEGSKSINDLPSARLRSTRTTDKIKSLVEAISLEDLMPRFDCQLTWHPTSETRLLPDVLPSNPEFPENSVIQELSGVIGGSRDGSVKFVVERTPVEPTMFHIWLTFPFEGALTPIILTQVIEQGSSMLETINLWGH